MSKTERILKLEAALLRRTPILDARGWAHELGVDTRTVQRDLKFLRSKRDLPVVHDPKAGGYRLDRPKTARVSDDDEERKTKWLALMDLMRRIYAQPGMTGPQLAKEMGYDKRTFHRHRRDLERILPLYNHRGYRFAADAFLPPLGLEPGELLSLFLGARLLEMEFPEQAGPDARRALEKLIRAVSETRRPDILSLRQKIQVSSPVEDTGAQHLLPLQAVIGNGRQLRLTYLGLQDAESQERTVDPMGLFGFRQVWYLRAFDHLRSDYRNFRLSRITSWELLETPVSHAPRMSLEEALYHRWEVEGRPVVEVRLRVTESLARWLEENPPHPSQTLEGDEVRYQVTELPAVARWLSSLHGVKALEPETLRGEMARLGRELLSEYG